MKNRAIILLLGLLFGGSVAFSQVVKDTLECDGIPHFHISTDSPIIFLPDEYEQIQKEAYRKQLEAKGLSDDEITKKMLEYELQKEAIQKEKDKQRDFIYQQKQVAEFQRKEVELQRKKAEVERREDRINRKILETEEKIIEEQKRLEEEWGKSFRNLLNESYILNDKDSKAREIKIKVTDKSALFFSISAEVNSGSVLIELTSPDGKKESELPLGYPYESISGHSTNFSKLVSGADSIAIQGPKMGFWVVSQRPEKSKMVVRGSHSKTINFPVIGDWLLKITPKDAIGNIHVSFAQYVKPSINE